MVWVVSMTKRLLKLTQNQIDPAMLVVLVVVSPSVPLVPFSSKYVRSFLVMANCLEWVASWESWVMVATPLNWAAFPCTKRMVLVLGIWVVSAVRPTL